MGYFGVVVQHVPAGPPAPGGSNRQVQFNDNGVLDGHTGLIYRKSTGTLEVGGPVKATGQLTTLCKAQPLDADIANGELVIWFDESAQRVRFKCKTIAGGIYRGFAEMHP